MHLTDITRGKWAMALCLTAAIGIATENIKQISIILIWIKCTKYLKLALTTTRWKEFHTGITRVHAPPPPPPNFLRLALRPAFFYFLFLFLAYRNDPTMTLDTQSQSYLIYLLLWPSVFRVSGNFETRAPKGHQNYLNNYKPKHNHIYIVICYKWLQISLSFHLPPVVFELLAFLRNVHRSPQWA